MKNKNAGFTLVEQLVVLAIIISMVGIGAVRMNEVYQKNSSEHAVKNMQAVLRFLQVKAIEEGLIYELSVKSDKKQIEIKRQAADSNELERFSASWISSIEMGKSLQMELERGRTLLFYPDGTSSKNRLVFINEKDGKRTTLELKNRIGTIAVKNV